MKKKSTLLAVSLFGTVVLVVGLILFWPKSIRWHANRVLDCIESEDAPCLISYMREEELLALGVDSGSVQRLLNEYVFEKTTSYATDTRMVTLTNEEQLDAQIAAKFSDGSEQVFAFTIAETSDGVKSPYLLLTFLLPVAQADYYRKISDQHSHNQALTWVRWCETTGPILEEKYGLKGIYRHDSEGVLTWDEWASHYRARLPAGLESATR